MMFVHECVLAAFVGQKLLPKYVARHLNGDKLDNRVENLAWGSPLQNARDEYDNGGMEKKKERLRKRKALT